MFEINVKYKQGNFSEWIIDFQKWSEDQKNRNPAYEGKLPWFFSGVNNYFWEYYKILTIFDRLRIMNRKRNDTEQGETV